jgi:hypothetical protein
MRYTAIPLVERQNKTYEDSSVQQLAWPFFKQENVVKPEDEPGNSQRYSRSAAGFSKETRKGHVSCSHGWFISASLRIHLLSEFEGPDQLWLMLGWYIEWHRRTI